jgi:hypothetical protein
MTLRGNHPSAHTNHALAGTSRHVTLTSSFAKSKAATRRTFAITDTVALGNHNHPATLSKGNLAPDAAAL